MKKNVCGAVMFFVLVSLHTAAMAGYPYESVCPGGGQVFDSDWYNGEKTSQTSDDFWVDIWNFAQCNCTSYVAWFINEFTDGRDVTDPLFTNSYQNIRWSDAKNWAYNVQGETFAHFSRQPEYFSTSEKSYPYKTYAGGIFDVNIAVAWWGSLSQYGHVAVVDKINWKADQTVESILISEYNWIHGQYSQRTLKPTDSGYPEGFLYFVTEDFVECDLMDVCNDGSSSSGGKGEASLPDFVPQKVTFQNSSGEFKTEFSPSEKITVTVLTRNDGSDSPHEVTVKFYLSNGEKEDDDPVKIGEGKIQPEHLESDEVDMETITLTAPTAPGVYNVTACVDTKDEVAEEHESNNCSTEAVFKVVGNPPKVKGMQFLADVNGDGRADAIVFYNTSDRQGEWWVAEAATDNTFRNAAPWGNWLGYGSKKQFVADVNADGLADVIMFFDDASHYGEWWVATANKSGYFENLSLWAQYYGVGSTDQFVADVNGDRFADAVTYYENSSHPNGDWYVALATAQQTFAYTNSLWATWLGKGAKARFVADVNADGKADVVLFYDDAYHPGDWFVGLASSRGTFDYTGTYWGRYLGQGSQKQFLADINGDRFADLVIYYDQPTSSPPKIGQWWGVVSNGQYFTGLTQWADQVGSGIYNADGTRNGQLLMGDANGDRFADICVFYDTSSRPGEWWIDPSVPSMSQFQGIKLWATWMGAGSTY